MTFAFRGELVGTEAILALNLSTVGHMIMKTREGVQNTKKICKRNKWVPPTIPNIANHDYHDTFAQSSGSSDLEFISH